MTVQKATNVTWHDGVVARSDRERIHGHKGVTLWMTGLSASGKSTIARRVEQLLAERGCFSYVLDGDNVRHGLNKDLGFSPKDRNENIRRIGEVAKLFTDAGAITMTAFISPYRADRDQVRALLAKGDFVEVHVTAPLATCEERDPKGLYKKVRKGELAGFTGISVLRGAARGRAHAAHRHDGSETCARSMVAYPRRAGDARRHVSALLLAAAVRFVIDVPGRVVRAVRSAVAWLGLLESTPSALLPWPLLSWPPSSEESSESEPLGAAGASATSVRVVRSRCRRTASGARHHRLPPAASSPRPPRGWSTPQAGG